MKIFQIILALLCFPITALADITQDLQDKYSKLQSFSASFSQKLTHQESGAIEERLGQLSFAKPLLIRFETTEPAELLIVNAKEVWDYLPEEKLAYKYAPEVVQDSRSILQVITGQSNLAKDFAVQIGETKDKLVQLNLYPKEPSLQLVEATLWVDSKRFLIMKARVLDFYGNTNELSFSQLQENPSLASRTFDFTPPAGVKIDNQQDQDLPERPLLQ